MKQPISLYMCAPRQNKTWQRRILDRPNPDMIKPRSHIFETDQTPTEHDLEMDRYQTSSQIIGVFIHVSQGFINCLRGGVQDLSISFFLSCLGFVPVQVFSLSRLCPYIDFFHVQVLSTSRFCPSVGFVPVYDLSLSSFCPCLGFFPFLGYHCFLYILDPLSRSINLSFHKGFIPLCLKKDNHFSKR